MEEWSYKKAGVDIDAGNEAAQRIRRHLQATRNLLVRGGRRFRRALRLSQRGL